MLYPQKKEYEIQVIVEFEDVDSYKIAHHTKLIAYLERARVHFLTDFGFELHSQNLSIVFFSLDVRFKKPAFLQNRLIVSVFLLSIDRFRFELGYKIKRGNELLLQAKSGIAFMDNLKNKVVPIPELLIEKMRQFV